MPRRRRRFGRGQDLYPEAGQAGCARSCLSSSRRQSRKHPVVPFDVGFVARETGFVLRFVDGFAVDEPTEPPAAGRSVSSRVFDHDLNRRGGPCDEGAVDAGQWRMFPSQFGEYRAIRERQRSVLIGLHRLSTFPEHAPELVQAEDLCATGDQFAIGGIRRGILTPKIGEPSSSASSGCEQRH